MDKSVPKPAKRSTKFTHELDPSRIQETIDECPTPIKIDGILKIPPYYINRFAFVKGRWFGKTLKEVYEKEFSTTITQDMIRFRNLRVNGALAPSPEVVLEQNYYFESRNHFHEKPVLDQEIEIVFEDDDLLVCNFRVGTNKKESPKKFFFEAFF